MEASEYVDIRDKCALCKSLDCCPEHCCNVISIINYVIVGQLQMQWLWVL